MKLVDWWESHPRDTRNITVVFVLDVALLLAAALGVPYLRLWWSVLANTVPNLFRAMLSQLIAVLFELPPNTGAGGTLLLYISQLLSLLVFHLAIAFLVGFLLRRKENTSGWRVMNYILLAVLLLGLHLIGMFYAYWSH